MSGGGGGRNRRLEELQTQVLEDEIRRAEELEADLEARRRLRQLGGGRRQLRFFGTRPIPTTPDRRLEPTTPVAQPTTLTSAQREIAAGNERAQGGGRGRGGGLSGGEGVGPGDTGGAEPDDR